MKSLKSLNARGFSHHFVMAFIVLATAIGGTYYLVASHAQTPYKNSYTCASQPQLRTGSTGPCVSFLQYTLGITPDGDFGPNTKLAVQQFQLANHVAGSSCVTSYTTCDGIVGPYTWAKVSASNNAQTQASLPKPVVAVPVAAPVKATTPTTAPKPVVGAICDGTKPTLKQGSIGNCVRYLQKDLGLSQDGDFGPTTNAKVVSFQKIHSLTSDGVVGACTWTALDTGVTSAACETKSSKVTTNNVVPVTQIKGTTPTSYAYGVSSTTNPSSYCYTDYKNVKHTNYISPSECDKAKAADQNNRKVTVFCKYTVYAPKATATAKSMSRLDCFKKYGTETSAPRSNVQKVTDPFVNVYYRITR